MLLGLTGKHLFSVANARTVIFQRTELKKPKHNFFFKFLLVKKQEAQF